MVFVPVYKPEPDALQKQAAGIARRRALEAQRKARIFDPKTRVIGVDVASLDALVAERREREQDERRRDRAFDQQSVEIARQLTELQRIRQRKILERNAQVQDYRARSQKVEDRRDYDLYDPALLRKQRPPRNGDDVDLPASSLQMFNGEDLHKRDRVRQQQRELSQWVRGSLAERDAIRADEVACEQVGTGAPPLTRPPPPDVLGRRTPSRSPRSTPSWSACSRASRRTRASTASRCRTSTATWTWSCTAPGTRSRSAAMRWPGRRSRCARVPSTPRHSTRV